MINYYILTFFIVQSCILHLILGSVSLICYFFIYKAFMLNIIMQLNISVRLTPQVTTIICHHMKQILLKEK